MPNSIWFTVQGIQQLLVFSGMGCLSLLMPCWRSRMSAGLITKPISQYQAYYSLLGNLISWKKCLEWADMPQLWMVQKRNIQKVSTFWITPLIPNTVECKCGRYGKKLALTQKRQDRVRFEGMNDEPGVFKTGFSHHRLAELQKYAVKLTSLGNVSQQNDRPQPSFTAMLRWQNFVPTCFFINMLEIYRCKWFYDHKH